MHLLGALGAGADEEGKVGAGRYIASAHAHELRDKLRAARKAADADMLAVPPADRDRCRIGLAQPRVLVIFRHAPVGEEVVRADHHHVDAVDCNDLLGVRKRVAGLELHHHRRRGIERRIGLGDRERAKLEMRQRARGRPLARRRKPRRRNNRAGLHRGRDMRRDHAERAKRVHDIAL